MIYYKSNILSDKLRINSAKWKRWVREFLPPDVLGGFQSGYARQFTLKEAFRVFLGGVLVGSLKFTVPEARRVLDDLHPWLKNVGFYSLRIADPDSTRSSAGEISYRIYIYPITSKKFGYTIRRLLTDSPGPEGERTETYRTRVLASPSERSASTDPSSARVLGVSSLYDDFISRLAA